MDRSPSWSFRSGTGERSIADGPSCRGHLLPALADSRSAGGHIETARSEGSESAGTPCALDSGANCSQPGRARMERSAPPPLPPQQIDRLLWQAPLGQDIEPRMQADPSFSREFGECCLESQPVRERGRLVIDSDQGEPGTPAWQVKGVRRCRRRECRNLTSGHQNDSFLHRQMRLPRMPGERAGTLASTYAPVADSSESVFNLPRSQLGVKELDRRDSAKNEIRPLHPLDSFFAPAYEVVRKSQ